MTDFFECFLCISIQSFLSQVLYLVSIYTIFSLKDIKHLAVDIYVYVNSGSGHLVKIISKTKEK